jgi:hypothetical protein
MYIDIASWPVLWLRLKYTKLYFHLFCMGVTLGLSHEGGKQMQTVSENRVLGRISGSNRKGQLAIEKCFILCTLQQTQLGRWRWTKHLTHKKKWELHSNFWLKNMRVEDYLSDLCLERRILKTDHKQTVWKGVEWIPLAHDSKLGEWWGQFFPKHNYRVWYHLSTELKNMPTQNGDILSGICQTDNLALHLYCIPQIHFVIISFIDSLVFNWGLFQMQELRTVRLLSWRI